MLPYSTDISIYKDQRMHSNKEASSSHCKNVFDLYLFKKKKNFKLF